MAEHGGEAPGGLHAPPAPRMILGNQFQRFREAADVTPDAAGYRIRASRSKISRMENGRVGFTFPIWGRLTATIRDSRG